jgi:hypothetical protein
MSAFTDRLYREWLGQVKGGAVALPPSKTSRRFFGGMGGVPPWERSETAKGYPQAQQLPDGLPPSARPRWSIAKALRPSRGSVVVRVLWFPRVLITGVWAVRSAALGFRERPGIRTAGGSFVAFF